MTQFSKQEKSWILYDVANSAFTMLVSTTIPIYFRSLAEQSVSEATASGIWGLATSIAVLILAILSPFLGALADYRGMKKKIFSAFLAVGVVGLLLLSFAGSWISYLMLFVLTRLCYSACNIFYDSMLVDVTPDERMDRVSSYGYALGYIGSCIPFTIGILLILLRPFGLSTQSATQISFIITAVWWVLLTIPLLRNVRQTHYLERRSNQVSHAFSRVGQTLKKIRCNPSIFYFILAYFCYIDGVYTIISMATTYGGEVGISDTSMILALLLTQFVALCHPLQQTCRETGHPKGHPHLHPHLLRHLCLWLSAGQKLGILGAGSGGRHGTGRHPVALPLLLRQNHPQKRIQRILWIF